MNIFWVLTIPFFALLQFPAVATSFVPPSLSKPSNHLQQQFDRLLNMQSSTSQENRNAGDAPFQEPFIKCCIVEVQPGRQDEFANVCKSAAAKSIAEEPGCLRLDILRVLDYEGKPVPNKFIVYEIFKDEEAYHHHGQQPYIKGVKDFVQSGGVAHEDAYVAKQLS